MLSMPLTLWTMWVRGCKFFFPVHLSTSCSSSAMPEMLPILLSLTMLLLLPRGKERCLTNQDGPSLRWRRHFLDHLLIGRGRNAGRGVLCWLGESHYGISCSRIHETLVPYWNSHCLEESPSNYLSKRQSSFSGSLIYSLLVVEDGMESPMWAEALLYR